VAWATASLAPSSALLPSAAAKPVNGTLMPILMSASAAWENKAMPTVARAKVRTRMGFIKDAPVEHEAKIGIQIIEFDLNLYRQLYPR
jgi:hypothetical protein